MTESKTFRSQVSSVKAHGIHLLNAKNERDLTTVHVKWIASADFYFIAGQVLQENQFIDLDVCCGGETHFQVHL